VAASSRLPRLQRPIASLWATLEANTPGAYFPAQQFCRWLKRRFDIDYDASAISHQKVRRRHTDAAVLPYLALFMAEQVGCPQRGAELVFGALLDVAGCVVTLDDFVEPDTDSLVLEVAHGSGEWSRLVELALAAACPQGPGGLEVTSEEAHHLLAPLRDFRSRLHRLDVALVAITSRSEA